MEQVSHSDRNDDIIEADIGTDNKEKNVGCKTNVLETQVLQHPQTPMEAIQRAPK